MMAAAVPGGTTTAASAAAEVPLSSRIILLLLLLLLQLPSSTAASAQTATTGSAVAIRAFLTHATQKIMAHDPVAAAASSSSPLELVAARNEYEPLLVVLQSSPVAIDGVTATVPGTAVEFRAARVGYVGVVNVSVICTLARPGQGLANTAAALPDHRLRLRWTRFVS
jgi:hypothetical protein